MWAVVGAFICAIFSAVHGQGVPAVVQARTCSPEAARLSAIIENMTAHLDENIESARADLTTLQAQVEESTIPVKQMLREKQASLAAVQSNIGHKRGQKSNAVVQQSILNSEQAELQQQSQALISECKEYEAVFAEQQKDNIRLLQFISALREAVGQKGFDAPNHQAMLQEVYRMLPTAMPTPDSSSHMAELQALLQVPPGDAKVTTTSTAGLVQELFQVLGNMETDTQESMKASDSLLKEQNADCKRRSDAIRDSAVEITDRLKTLADSIVAIGEELERLSLEEGYVQEEVSLLKLAITDKAQVMSEVKTIQSERTAELSRQADMLRELFNQMLPTGVLCA